MSESSEVIIPDWLKTPQEHIREIWEEMKELKRLRDDCAHLMRRAVLEKKYSEIEILFGREGTLEKAIIYYLNQKHYEKK